MRASNIQELLSQLRIRLVVPAPEGRPRGRLGLANAAHLGAEVNRFEVDGNAVGLQDARERLGDVATEAFLNGEAPREKAQQSGELGDANDVLVGNVAQIGMTEEGEGVMLAERIEGNRAFDHLADLAVGTTFAFRREGGHQLGIALITLGRVEHRSKVALRCFDGARRVERHAERPKDLAYVTLEALPVVVTDPSGLIPLPVSTLDVLIMEATHGWIQLSLSHQFGCSVSSDRRTSICPFWIRVS